jgi:hypothetical protein
MSSISQLEDCIRELINRPQRQYALLKAPASWNMLCSCLDVIGDTELAFAAFVNKADLLRDGEKYLLVYGALQALFIQQDAVENLAEALGVTYEANPQLKQIREVRNDSIGHPTKRYDGKAFNFIGRYSLTHHGFRLMKTFSEDREPVFFDVNIPDLIKTQQMALTKALTEMIAKLKEEDMKHKREFRDEKLQDLFSLTLDYSFEKIFAACGDSEVTSLGAAMLEGLIERFEKFKSALQKRGILREGDFTSHDLELVEYPMSELKTFFRNPSGSTLNHKGAYIFAYFLKNTWRPCGVLLLK